MLRKERIDMTDIGITDEMQDKFPSMKIWDNPDALIHFEIKDQTLYGGVVLGSTEDDEFDFITMICEAMAQDSKLEELIYSAVGMREFVKTENYSTVVNKDKKPSFFSKLFTKK